MSDTPSSLGGLFVSCEQKRKKLEHFASASLPEFQNLLLSTIADYKQCQDLADRLSIFSANETLDDVTTNHVQYFLLNYHLATLYSKRAGDSRKTDLVCSQSLYASFLKLADDYGLLGKDSFALFEQYQESPNTFSVISSSDLSQRRENKIRIFKEEKELKQRLEILRSQVKPTADHEIARSLYLQEIHLAVHDSFQALESIGQELHILSLAPPEPPSAQDMPLDVRDRTRGHDGYSDRLDGPLSAGLTGPLLDSKGRPMRPFTLLDKRQQLRDGVFRPDHNLPTMTIDEYLEEERKRGGIIEGGGPASGLQPEPDEDNIEKADAETMKARAWDDFKDDNPKGAGNTLNRG